MDFSLHNYGSFDSEQEFLAVEGKRKGDIEEIEAQQKRAVKLRSDFVRDCFLRMSRKDKNKFLLNILKNLQSIDALEQIISYIMTFVGKTGAYIDVNPTALTASTQLFIDHNRSLEEDTMKETMCDHLHWIKTCPVQTQIVIFLALLDIAGGTMIRQIFFPIIRIYNLKLMEIARKSPQSDQTIVRRLIKTSFLVNEKHFDLSEHDDSDKYPRNHPLTIEVEQMRKKFSDLANKYGREIFDPEKPKKTDKSNSGVSSSMVECFPIWIVKKIFSYLDSKSLANAKKVNAYWAYAAQSLLQDQKARQSIDEAIEKRFASLGVESAQSTTTKSVLAPRDRRLKKLMIRGTLLKELRPKVKKTNQTRASFFTMIGRNAKLYDPIDHLEIFPRLIQEDLELYKEYPCILKDVNVAINMEDEIRKTLSYSLSQHLSDTFSLSEADITDW